MLLWLCVNCTICLMRFLSTSEKWNERTLTLKKGPRGHNFNNLESTLSEDACNFINCSIAVLEKFL